MHINLCLIVCSFNQVVHALQDVMVTIGICLKQIYPKLCYNWQLSANGEKDREKYKNECMQSIKGRSPSVVAIIIKIYIPLKVKE